jgi:hypothetical protein
VFSPGMTVTRVPPYVPTLQGEPANRKGMISAPPVVPGGQEISLGSQNLGPTGGGVPSRRSGLIWVIPIWSETPCVRQGLPHGHIVLAVICWSPCAQRRCCPTGRCCLPTFSHFLIGHKTSLSRARLLSLSSLSLLSLSLSLSLSIPNPRKRGSVIGPEPGRSGPSCVLLKRVPQGRTESWGIVPAAIAEPRVPRGGVTRKRRCTYRHSVIYLIVNKLLSLTLSYSLGAP